MNAYVYGYGAPGKERLILVDLGVTFPDMETTPGVDLIMADVSWLVENRDRLEAIFITHAHEDHVGAIGRLWSELRVPVYARAFTAHHARRKMEEAGQDPDEVITAAAYPEKIEVGPFKVAFVPISHSIPESAGLVIDTPAGRIAHSGDFKIDLEPGVGEAFDEAIWREATGAACGPSCATRPTCSRPNPAGPRPSLAPRSPSWSRMRRIWWWRRPLPPTWRG